MNIDWDAIPVPVLAQYRLAPSVRARRCSGPIEMVSSTCSIGMTGEFLLGKKFVKQNWNSASMGKADEGTRVQVEHEGTFIQPSVQGGTNWSSPSFSPRTQLFYVSSWQNGSQSPAKAPAVWKEGERYTGVGQTAQARAAASSPARWRSRDRRIRKLR